MLKKGSKKGNFLTERTAYLEAKAYKTAE